MSEPPQPRTQLAHHSEPRFTGPQQPPLAPALPAGACSHLGAIPVPTVPEVEDIAAALEPGVGEISWVRLSLARQKGILGDIDGDVLGWHHDDRWPCSVKQRG